MIELKKKISCSFAALSVLSMVGLASYATHAADHQEAPAATALLSADIGDYFVWHEEDQLNAILTFGTFAVPGQAASFDENILYGMHFDTSADGISDIDVFIRFAQNAQGDWGLQVSGISDSPLEGPVETVITNGELNAWAGLADDPFFFDQSGFIETTTTGQLAFDPSNDDVAGLNVTAIAIQFPTSAIVSSGGTLQTWSTTSTL